MVVTVVLDVDDTLYLERDYVRSGFDAVAAHLVSTRGLNGFAAAAWARFEAGDRGRIFDDTLADLISHDSGGHDSGGHDSGGHDSGDNGSPRPGAGSLIDLVAELVEVYRRHVPRIALEPDALRLFERLSGRANLAVITDGPLDSQRAKVRALGLAAWCDPVICTDALGREHWKPSPVAFELVAAKHGGRPESLVYIGDNPHKDFVAPRRLGWRTIRLRRPLGQHAGLEPAGHDAAADIEVSSLDEVDLTLLRGSADAGIASHRR